MNSNYCIENESIAIKLVFRFEPPISGVKALQIKRGVGDVLDVFFRQEQIVQLGQSGLVFDGLEGRGCPGVVDELPLGRFGDVVAPDEIDDPAYRQPVVEHLQLDEAQCREGEVADEEMAVDGFLVLEIDGPGLQVGLHHPEALLYPPQPVVGPVYLPGRLLELGGDYQVVSGVKEVLVDLGLVERRLRLDYLPVFGRGDEIDVLGGITVIVLHGFPDAHDGLRLVYLPLDGRPLLPGERRVVGDDALLPGVELHFFPSPPSNL